MKILELLHKAVELNASDLHISVGLQPVFRINGKLIFMDADIIKPEDSLAFVQEILNKSKFSELVERGEIDTSISVHGSARFRVNIFRQRGTYSIAFRHVKAVAPSFKELGLPENVLKNFCELKRGMVIVTGPTGSGKSTTLASMVREINNNRGCHIITLEDPIEYLHRHNKSIVNQREIGTDSTTYTSALRAALRQDPDVILIGEMRDLDSIQIALTAAETGHLVLSTLHTVSASQTIDRIIDVFPPHQQQQIRIQLSMTLQGILAQQLITNADGKGRSVAVEVLIANSAIRNLIREGKTHQIDGVIQTSAKLGMRTMDSSIIELFKNRKISSTEAINHAVDIETVRQVVRPF